MLTETQQSFLQTLHAGLNTGGPVMYILLALSIIAMTLILVKLYQFWSLGLFVRQDTEPAVTQWLNGRHSEAIASLENSRHPVHRVCHFCMSKLINWQGQSDRIHDAVQQVGKNEIHQLGKGLWLLELIGGISPLLGLFGTVLGMIEAFKALQIAGTQVNPAILSGGIWQALLTTAAGLAVAIPVVMIGKWLERITINTGFAMEDCVTRLFTGATQVTDAIQPSAYGKVPDAKVSSAKLGV